MPAINDDVLMIAPCNLYLFPKGRASLTTALTGTDNDMTLRATDTFLGATGNDVQLAILGGTGTAALSVAVAVVGNVRTINVTAARTASVITSTADEVIAAINNSAGASALVTATRKSGDLGTGVVIAQAATNLTLGSDTTEEEFLGALLGEVVLSTRTDAIPLVAAQTGSVARKKIISGGQAQLSFTMAEITMDRFRRAVANARLFEQSSTIRRLDVGPRIGADMRRLAMKMKLIPIIDGAETADLERHITFPLAAPVDGDVPWRFVPDTQQGYPTVYEIWPDSVTNRWYFLGTETL